LKVSIYSSAVTQSWLHVNVNSSLTSYLLHRHVTSLVCMSVVKICDKFIRPTTVLLWQICSTKHITRFRSLPAQKESLIDTHGPRRVKKSGGQTHPWWAREREPIMGVWGQSPQRRSRGRAPSGCHGAKPPEADEVFVYKTVIFNASATVLHEMMYCLSCFFCKVSK